MKQLFYLVSMFITLQSFSQNQIHVIPQPVEMKQLKGSFVVSDNIGIGYDDVKAKQVADYLAEKLNLPTGYNIKPRQSKATIQLSLNKSPNSKLGTEGYSLQVNSKGISLSANEPAGLFYGVQTLLQLLPKEIESNKMMKTSLSVPAVHIEDYPRFGWRGLMLDVSRHFFTKEEVKAYIDQMSRYKFNTFHWHLTDDNGWRIEIKSLPKLTEVGAWRVPREGHFGTRKEPQPGEEATYGGFYTHEDIREIVQYAAERFVTIIPEIDVPGHSMAMIAAYPELSCTKDPNIKVNPGTAFSEWYGNGTFKMLIDNSLNPSDEKVYEYLDKVFTEVAELFPNPYIHVGGDECYKGYWLQDEGCRALMKKLDTRHVEDLQGYFMGRVEDILKKKGKKMLGWDEIMEGGVSTSATVMNWRDMKYGEEAAHVGHDVVMTNTKFAYLDYYQGDIAIEPPVYAGLRMKTSYSFDPVPKGVDPSKILGGQGNLWTEQIPTLRHAQYMTWPRGWALSEVFWSPVEEKSYELFVQKVEKHFQRADQAEINYSKAIYDAIIKISIKEDKLFLEMESEVPDLDIYYTVDGTIPDLYSKKYTGIVELPQGQITLRVRSYRKDQPLGNMIIVKPEELRRRAGS